MTGPQPIAEGRFLILAPIGRDAELIAAQLQRAGHGSVNVHSTEQAVALAAEAAGVIITEEALTREAVDKWHKFVQAEPPWSDLPFMLLSGDRQFGTSRATAHVRELLGNVSVLDRPVRTEMLISAVDAAWRARKRQYEIRDAMHIQREAERAIRETERLAVAGRLAATISHEINNPLSAVTNLVYLARHSTTPQDSQRFLVMAEEELRRVSDIVHQTLRFHRAPSEPAENPVRELLDSCVALFRHQLNRKNIYLVRDYDSDLVAYCSSGEVRQVIVNLIANAVDAMPFGGRLIVAARPLTARATGVVIYIGDTGSGIPADIRSRVFQQFFTTKGTTGTGLGLWITRDIVQRNGGSIRYRTRTQQPSGTVFSVWLPCERPAGASPLPSAGSRARVVAE